MKGTKVPMTSGEVGLDRTDLVGEFIAITPALVRRLGGNVNAAAALVRIEYRTNVYGFEHGGFRWYAATREELSEDTGMSPRQVDAAIARLEREGLLVTAKLHRGRGDHTKSYRIVYLDGGAGRAMRRGAPQPEPEAPAEPDPGAAEQVDSPIGDMAPTSHFTDRGDLDLTDRGDPDVTDRGDLPIGEEDEEGGEGEPPSHVLFPRQCRWHQDGENYQPCHACRAARERHDAAAAARAAEAAEIVRCDEHGTLHPAGAVCSGCRADMLVGG